MKKFFNKKVRRLLKKFKDQIMKKIRKANFY